MFSVDEANSSRKGRAKAVGEVERSALSSTSNVRFVLSQLSLVSTRTLGKVGQPEDITSSLGRAAENILRSSSYVHETGVE
eukprot:6186902-Pleurochrysis_carterae.AAC.1